MRPPEYDVCMLASKRNSVELSAAVKGTEYVRYKLVVAWLWMISSGLWRRVALHNGAYQKTVRSV
jgi:hypothetical protein